VLSQRLWGTDSDFDHVSLPGALDAILDRLIARAFVRIHGECSLGLFPGAGWNLESVSQADLGDLENPVHVLNVAFHETDEILGRFDFPRFQRGRKGSGESPGNAGNDVIQGRRIFGAFDFTAVLQFVEVLYSTVDAEVKGLCEVLDVGCAVRALVLQDTDVTGVGYGHRRPPA
jgi:hypothetical protein